MKKIIGLLSLCLVLFLGTNAKGRPIENIAKSSIKASYSSPKLVKELDKKVIVIKKQAIKKDKAMTKLVKKEVADICFTNFTFTTSCGPYVHYDYVCWPSVGAFAGEMLGFELGVCGW